MAKGVAQVAHSHVVDSLGVPTRAWMSAKRRRSFTYAGRIAVFLIPITLLSIILWYIWNRTPQTPFLDEWENVPLVLHLHQGTLRFADFWAFHNEHRIVIPRMLDLALILLTRWNEQAMMTFDLGLSVIEAALLLAAIRRSLNSTGWMFAMVAPVTLLVLSLGQYENWLWAYQITFILTGCGIALCVYGFSRQPAGWRFFALALVGAFIAAWSSVGGTMAWLAFAPMAWRAGRAKGLLWTLTGAVVLTTYFQGFPHSVPIRFSPDVFTYVVGYLGISLGEMTVLRSIISGAIGLALALINLVIYWRSRAPRIPLDAWVGLALFAALVASLTAMGRAVPLGMGVDGINNLETSRYQLFSALWWVALFVLMVINIYSNRSLLHDFALTRRTEWPQMALWLINVLALLLCVGTLIRTNDAALSYANTFDYPERQRQACVQQYQSAPDACLLQFFPRPAYVRQQAAVLQRYHLSIFAGDPHADVSPAPSGPTPYYVFATR